MYRRKRSQQERKSKTEIKELQHIYGNWIKFPTDKDTEYEITAQDCTITFAYLSECENILKNGICVLNTTDNFKAMNKEEFLKRLEQLLSDISEEERADALAFYRSYFEDAGIGNEASILEELESPEKVAEVIKKDLGVSETADAETPEEDVRSEKNETHTEGTSGDGQNAKTRMDDPYMNSLYGSSTYGSGNYEQKNTAYTGGTYGSQNTSGQIDIENLKKENQKNKTEKTVLWVILAVLTSPVWITVAAVLAAILVAVLACVFAVAVSIVAVMAALVITGFVLAGIGVGYLFTKGVAVGLGLLGGGLLVLALGVLAVWLVVWCFGWFVPWAVKGIAELCKKAFGKTKRGV